MSGITVGDEGDLRKYRTEIPNLVLEMDLTPYQLALYIHLKRTAGNDGKCWKAVRRLASETGISRSEISRARQVLQEKGLIEVHQPKDPTKATEVTIVDVWEKNMVHFAHVSPHGTRRGLPEGHRKEPIEEGVEANASTAKPKSVKPVALEKHIVDGIYEAMREAKLRLPNEHYPYHLGRAKDVIEKDDPTDEEIADLPAAFVRAYKIWGKADAHTALIEMRRQQAREEVLAEDSQHETPHPHSPEAQAARDKPRSIAWYEAFYPDIDKGVVERWIREGATHTELVKRLEARAA